MNLHLSTTITIRDTAMAITYYSAAPAFRAFLKQLDVHPNQVNHIPGAMIVVLEEKTPAGQIHDLTLAHQCNEAARLSGSLNTSVHIAQHVNGVNIANKQFLHGEHLEQAA